MRVMAERRSTHPSRSVQLWSSRFVVALVVAIATVSTTTGSVLDDVAQNRDSPPSAVELVVGSSDGLGANDVNLDNEVQVAQEKRKSGRFTAFRSDLGKRGADTEEQDDKKRSFSVADGDDVKRAVYRMRGGKAFKADLGKRPASTGRAMTLFRSDLGRRSVPIVASDLDDYDDDDDAIVIEEAEAKPEIEVERRASRMPSMFRSDLGKRLPGAASPISIRRMFRADLGKRARARVPFRHDLG